MFRKIWDGFVKFISTRTVIHTGLLLVVAGILLSRMFSLQIIHGEDYLNTFQLRIRRERDIQSSRGNIYDRNGTLLAYNELANSVAIEDVFDTGSGRNSQMNGVIDHLIGMIEKNGDSIVSNFNIAINKDGTYAYTVEGTKLKRFLADVYGYRSADQLSYEERSRTAGELITYLADQFGIGAYEGEGDKKTFVPGKGYTKDRLLKIITIRYDMNLNSFQRYIDTIVATNVSDETVADVMENAIELEGVSIVEETARRYVDAQYFSQIIGYTGKVDPDELETLQKQNPNYDLNDTVGKAGIEQTMETTLQGTKGSETVYVDNVGKVIETSDYVDPIAGNDVYLTIDKDLQEDAYNILEQRLAGILVGRIRNVSSGNGATGSDIIIPIYDVYYALFNNAVIDISHFEEKNTGPTEKAVYSAFQRKEKTVFQTLRQELSGDGTPYESLQKEYQAYESFLVQMLYDDGVLMRDAVDQEDETYIAWTKDETISLSAFLHYAIAQNWVDVTHLQLDNQYSDAEEIYNQVLSYAFSRMQESTDFVKHLYKYMLDDGEIAGSQVCQVLLEQGVVKVDAKEERALRGGAESAYTFMIRRITNLDITPAQLNLDPCSGSMVITDVNSGDVLALVSYPSYDNNKMANGVDAEYYAKLRSDLSRPQYNYATQQKTAPGSTFKLVSATAGLQEGVITPGTAFNCAGPFEKIQPSPHCWIYPGGHGSLNVTEAIRHSCNYFFFSVGYNLGVQNGAYSSDTGLNKLKQYADLYGLTEKSGIEIEESDPQVSDFDSVRSAIGQGTNAYTTVGLARYVTTVANSGTCYNLTLIDKIMDPGHNPLKENSASVRNTIDLSAAYWDAMHRGMREVVENMAYFDGMPVHVAGKTGTAQETATRANHALFVCYAPYESPEIAIATRIANGYTSSYAAQITRDVVADYYGVTDRDELITGTAQELTGGALNAD